MISKFLFFILVSKNKHGSNISLYFLIIQLTGIFSIFRFIISLFFKLFYLSLHNCPSYAKFVVL